MIRRARLVAWLISFALGLAAVHVAAPVHAQQYDEATIAAVNAHFEKGAQLYYDGDYDGAIAEWEAAHEKIPNAIFLYNISKAQARKGETEKSLATAREADEFGGLGSDERQQNKARIVALERVLAANDAAVDIEKKRLPPVDPVFQFGLAGWIGTGLVVGGLLGLGGVAVIDQSLSADVDAYREAADSGNTAEYDRLRDEIRPRQTGGRVLFVVSTVAVAAGAGLIFYDVVLRKKSDTTVTLTPVTGGVGVSLHQRF